MTTDQPTDAKVDDELADIDRDIEAREIVAEAMEKTDGRLVSGVAVVVVYGGGNVGTAFSMGADGFRLLGGIDCVKQRVIETMTA